MCKYCEALVPFPLTPLAGEARRTVAQVDGDRLLFHDMEARIDYCPMCGRRLLEYKLAEKAKRGDM